MEKLSIAIFAGSLRARSYNRQLMDRLVAMAPDNVAFTPLSIGDIPLFNQDVEDQGVPAPVADFKKTLIKSDGTIIVSPEYSHSTPGVLKNTLDWASRGPDVALRNKPVAICGASSGRFGTARGQEHLRQVLAAHGAICMPLPLLYVINGGEAFDTKGEFTDAKTHEAAEFFLQSFAEFVKKWQ